MCRDPLSDVTIHSGCILVPPTLGGELNDEELVEATMREDGDIREFLRRLEEV